MIDAYNGMGPWPLRVHEEQPDFLGTPEEGYFLVYFCEISGWQDVSSGAPSVIRPDFRPR